MRASMRWPRRWRKRQASVRHLQHRMSAVDLATELADRSARRENGTGSSVCVVRSYPAYVNYYGAHENRDDVTIAQISIVNGENTSREKQQVFRVPLRKPGELL